MRPFLLLAAATVLATSTFAQARGPLVSFNPVEEDRPQAEPNYHFHARFGDTCFFSPSIAPASDNTAGPFASVEIVQAHGGPNWQPSSFMNFPDAVTVGQQQAALAPSKQSNPAMVQQLLDLFQQVRAVEDQNRLDGKSDPVKWADLKPTLDPSDYRRPPTTFMDYPQALALGAQAEAHAQDRNQTPSLGEVARNQSESKPAGEKAKVVIKQDASGNPEIVHKKQ
ncbi:MAG: hypothetical protein WBP79_05035 [Candidatus Acidiferrales bacterium]